MDKKIFCDKHKKEILVACIYSDCLEPLLCNDCFEDHQSTHSKCYLSYKDYLDFEMGINAEKLNLPQKLNKERKEIFKESIKTSINRFQKTFIELSDQFENIIQDFSNFKDDNTEEILNEVRNENLTNDILKDRIRNIQRIRNLEKEIINQKKMDSSFINRMNIDFGREMKLFKVPLLSSFCAISTKLEL